MSQQDLQFDIPKSQRSPTASTTPKVIFSVAQPAQHKHLKDLPKGTKSSREIPDGIPLQLFSFADCVLSHSVSEGPSGRREILLQENDLSPVKLPTRTNKEEVITPPKALLELHKFHSAPEVQEVKEPAKSPSHAALTSLLNLILKEQTDYEEQSQQSQSRGKTPEKTRQLSMNLVNKFSGLQKGGSNHHSQTSLQDNQLSQDRTTEKSSRINTEPTSIQHSRVPSFTKITIDTHADVIWETAEVESGTIYRQRTSRLSRLSADYSHLAKQYEDYPVKPVEPSTPTLSPKRLHTEDNSPVKSAAKKSPKKGATPRNYGSRIKQIKTKLFPVKPQSLSVRTTLARWPVA